jgi:hypothetical protein
VLQEGVLFRLVGAVFVLFSVNEVELGFRNGIYVVFNETELRKIFG